MARRLNFIVTAITQSLLEVDIRTWTAAICTCTCI